MTTTIPTITKVITRKDLESHILTKISNQAKISVLDMF